MWCKHCRQDTPAIRSTLPPGMRCGRCGGAVFAANPSATTDTSHPAEIGLDLGSSYRSASTAGTAGVFEDWNIDDTLRTVEQKLNEPSRRRTARPGQAQTRRDPQPQRSPEEQPYWRIDGAHVPLPKPHRARPRRTAKTSRSGGGLARGVLWLGLATLLTGASLLGYAMVDRRLDLWNLGLPTLASGAGAFLLGLVLQLEHIRRNSRLTIARLKQLDTHLAELERTTTLLSVTQGGSSQAFYAHMAEQASPNLLLADLKGQIDLLSLKLGKRPTV